MPFPHEMIRLVLPNAAFDALVAELNEPPKVIEKLAAMLRKYPSTLDTDFDDLEMDCN